MSVDDEILSPAQGIIAAVFEKPQIALLDKEKQAEFLDAVRAAALVKDPDTASAKGRELIRKNASRVTKSKTALDASRKALTEDLRKQVSTINASANGLIESLDALAKEVRRPLTEWEDAEAKREQECNQVIAWMRNAGIVIANDTSATIRARGKTLFAIEITREKFGRLYDEAEALKNTTMASLKAALDRVIKDEDEREEAAARAEQERKEREERELLHRRQEYGRKIIAATYEIGQGRIGGQVHSFGVLLHELTNKIPAEIEKGLGGLEDEARQVLSATLAHIQDQAAARAAQEAAEAQRQEEARIAQIKRNAAEAAEREAKENAQRKIDEANRRAELAEQERLAEIKRAADAKAEADRVAAAERIEREKREKSRKHRNDVQAQAVNDLARECGMSEESALAAVKAITGGKIRHIAITF